MPVVVRPDSIATTRPLPGRTNRVYHRYRTENQELDPELDPRLAELILRCLAKDPDDRFRNGSEVHYALAGLRI